MEKALELGDAFRALHRRLTKQLQKEIPTPNRIIVTLGVIKASGSEEIDIDQFQNGEQLFFNIEDMRISTSFLVKFSKDRDLSEFAMSKVLDTAADVVNSGALDHDGITVTVTPHKAGAE